MITAIFLLPVLHFPPPHRSDPHDRNVKTVLPRRFINPGASQARFLSTWGSVTKRELDHFHDLLTRNPPHFYVAVKPSDAIVSPAPGPPPDGPRALVVHAQTALRAVAVARDHIDSPVSNFDSRGPSERSLKQDVQPDLPPCKETQAPHIMMRVKYPGSDSSKHLLH